MEGSRIRLAGSRRPTLACAPWVMDALGSLAPGGQPGGSAACRALAAGSPCAAGGAGGEERRGERREGEAPRMGGLRRGKTGCDSELPVGYRPQQVNVAACGAEFADTGWNALAFVSRLQLAHHRDSLAGIIQEGRQKSRPKALGLRYQVSRWCFRCQGLELPSRMLCPWRLPRQGYEKAGSCTTWAGLARGVCGSSGAL